MTMDEIFQRARGVVNAAAQKTGEAIDYSKIKLEIMKSNNELREAYELLGKTFYSMCRDQNENQELLDSLMTNITEIIGKLNDLNAKIEDKKKTLVCPLCGSKNLQDSVFCAKCGARLQMQNVDAESEETAEDEEE